MCLKGKSFWEGPEKWIKGTRLAHPKSRILKLVPICQSGNNNYSFWRLSCGQPVNPNSLCAKSIQTVYPDQSYIVLLTMLCPNQSTCQIYPDRKIIGQIPGTPFGQITYIILMTMLCAYQSKFQIYPHRKIIGRFPSLPTAESPTSFC